MLAWLELAICLTTDKPGQISEELKGTLKLNLKLSSPEVHGEAKATEQ